MRSRRDPQGGDDASYRNQIKLRTPWIGMAISWVEKRTDGPCSFYEEPGAVLDGGVGDSNRGFRGAGNSAHVA